MGLTSQKAKSSAPETLEGSWVIERHAVLSAKHFSALREAGFSEMQERIAISESPGRIVSAPTGSGKSFVFGMLAAGSVSGVRESGEGGVPGSSKGKRVLFVSPTVRLVESLQKDTRDFFEKKLREHWRKFSGQEIPDSDLRSASGEFAIAISGAKAKEEALGGKRWPDIQAERAGALRRRIRGGFGQMVFVTPEIFAAFAMGKKTQGATEVGVVSMLMDFDHVVFDEVHALSETGMGLPLATLRIAADMAKAGDRHAKVTLLSATQPDSASALKELELDGELRPGIPLVEMVAEVVGAIGDRYLHGDVEVRFEKESSLARIALRESKRIREEIHPSERGEAGGKSRQVVIIFDRLKDLHECLVSEDLKKLYEVCGIDPKDVLIVNSADDRNERSGESGINGEMSGSKAEMSKAKLILATSSVEAGVTFSGCRLIIMDPGFGAGSFSQRVGRCARGDIPGLVIVRIPPDAGKQKGLEWLRRGIARLGAQGRISVSKFAESFAKASVPLESGTLPVFGSVGLGRAAMWILAAQRDLERKKMGNLPAHKPLMRIRFGKMKALWALTKEIESQGHSAPHSMRSAIADWIAAVWSQARGLRDFNTTVVVVDAGGRRPYSLGYIERSAPVALERGVLEPGSDGNWELSLPKGERIENMAGTKSKSRSENEDPIRDPFGASCLRIGRFSDDRFGDFERELERSASAAADPARARNIAKKIASLARISGIIPTGDEALDSGDKMI